jgi:DHA3 family tetracycline resistance protein-like MFS transporter
MPSVRPRARTVYLAAAAVEGLLWAVFTTVYSLYVIRVVGLDPLQLVLMGTALEATYFLFEVPTGVVADVVSRKASIVAGWLITGAAMVALGLVRTFPAALLTQAVWAFGATFISGADVAWITDEVGETEARPMYLRAAQLENAGAFAGIWIGIGLATIALWIPIVVAGSATVASGLALWLVMSEEHFVRPTPDQARRLHESLRETLGASVRTVRGHPVLLLVLGVAALHGMSTEGFDRLSVLHILRTGLPAFAGLDRILWFGVIDTVALAIGVGTTEYVRRNVDLEHINGAAWTLLVVDAALIASVVVFGLVSAFAVAVFAYWIVWGLRTVRDPVFLGWINRDLDPRTRATVNSIGEQADAVGQMLGGPILGVIAVARSVTAAIVAAGLVRLPVAGLYARAIGRGAAGALDAAEVRDAGDEEPTTGSPAGPQTPG